MFPSIQKVGIVLLLINSACAHAETSITLTTTVHTQATAEEKTLMQGLLPLMEVAVGEKEGLQVVEREAVAVILAELARSLGANEPAPLQTGQMDAASLVVAVKLSPLKEPANERFVLVRITEAATAVIRGVTAVPISAVLIEEATTEIADYVAAIAKGPKSQRATIAVLPFESVERFDRLRPLERGLRDLFASALLRQGACRVVQRSSMEQLLMELDLVRAGLTAGGRGLEGAPAREAAYVLRGEIDEQIRPTDSLVLLKVELVDAKSQKVVSDSDKSCKREDLVSSVAEIAEEISQAISDGKQQPVTASTNGKKEINRLFEMATRDVFKFIRKCPDDDGHYPLSVPGLRRRQFWRGNIDPESSLGKHLLLKSVDRLESVLFVVPDHRKAAFLLAYCRSFHVEGVWQPQQCESLLHRLIVGSQEPKLQKIALQLLADMYFRHQGGLHGWEQISKIDPELIKTACEHRLEAFSITPANLRDSRWVRLLRVFVNICADSNNESLQQHTLTTIKTVANQPSSLNLPKKTRDSLTNSVANIASSIARNRKNPASLKKEALQLLLQWTSDQDPRRRLAAAKKLYHLGEISLKDCSDIIQSVVSNEKSAIPAEGWTEDIVWLSDKLLENGEPESALSLLAMFDPNQFARKDYHAPHGYGFQLGKCYEQLGRKQDALYAYLKYIELPAHYGSSLDFETRIRSLGGVPLEENRAVDIRYPEFSVGEPVHCKFLATDGDCLFCAGGFTKGHDGSPIRSVCALDFKTNTWKNLGGPNKGITCLAVAEGFLWTGTKHRGLWRMSLASGAWQHWTTDQGLPINTIVHLALHEKTAFVSLGNVNSYKSIISGGVARVTVQPNSSTIIVHVYRDKQAPQVASESMALHEGRLLATGLSGKVHVLDLESDRWSLIPRITSPIVDSGDSGVWGIKRGYIASLLEVSEEEEKRFPAKGRLKHYPAGTYRPRFIVEHDGNLWIGGKPWRTFRDTGLFRLDLTTGQLNSYGSRQGFRYEEHNDYECYDGVWANDRLWVATSFGLAEVTMRDPSERDSKTQIGRSDRDGLIPARRTGTDAPMRKIRDMRGQGWSAKAKHSPKSQPKAEALSPIDRLDEKGFSQLHRAASSGNVAFAQRLMDQEADVDIPQRTFHGTPLQYAASAGQVAMVEWLIKHKATVDATDTRGRTPLLWAASQGHPVVVQVLIEAGADINKTNRGRWTALHYAADKDHLEVAQVLIEKGASLTLKNSQGKTPLDLNPNIAPPQ